MCCIVLKFPYLCVVNGENPSIRKAGGNRRQSIAMNLLNV